ncbi:MAG: ABC transporter substrate-binding protein [Candidatus Binatia bacterium]
MSVETEALEAQGGAAFLCVGVAMVLLAFSPLDAQASGEDAAARGRVIFSEGTGSGEISAYLSGPDIVTSGSAFACKNCHGENGSGGFEGGVRVPDIRPEKLRSEAKTVRDNGRDRRAYNDFLVARAIRSGLDSEGNSLHPGMPRYTMSEADMNDLLAFLEVVGEVRTPGVTEDEIAIATVLPSAGTLSAVASYSGRVLEAWVEEFNDSGGIYGRRLNLNVYSFDGTEGGAAVRAVERALSEGPFCFVANLGLDDAALDLLASSDVPVIAPVIIPPKDGYSKDNNTFYLYSSMADQAKVLVDYLVEELVREEASLAVVYVDDESGRAASEGVRDQAGLHGLRVVATRQYQAGSLDPAVVVDEFEFSKPAALFFFGSGADALSLAREIGTRDWKPLFFGSAETLGSALMQLSEEAASRVYLSSPVDNPDMNSRGMYDFLALVEERGIEGKHKAFQLSTYAGLAVMREGLRKSGRELSRERFVGELNSLWKFETGVMPELTFDLNRRVGLRGANVVTMDTRARAFLAAGSWREPRQASSSAPQAQTNPARQESLD